MALSAVSRVTEIQGSDVFACIAMIAAAINALGRSDLTSEPAIPKPLTILLSYARNRRIPPSFFCRDPPAPWKRFI